VSIKPPTAGTPGVSDTSLETSVSQRSFNVKDATYGAVGNNSTNDTVAIQAAITAANAAGGGIVFFPKGTYKVGALTLYDDVTLEGVAYDLHYTARGSRLSLIAGTNANMLTAAWGVGNITIRNLHLEGNYASQSGTSYGVYFAYDPANTGPQTYQQSILFRCSVKGFLSGGVYAGKWNEAVNVDQCFIGNNGGHGVQFETSDCQVANSHIISNAGDGVRVGNSGCQVVNNPSIFGNLRGVAVVSGGVDTVEFTQTTFVTNHQIHDNHIDKNLQEGVYIEALDTSVQGNFFASNGTQTNNSYANVNFRGKLSDNATVTYGNSLIGNTFGNLNQTNKPNYHVAVSNYGASTVGLIAEGGNVYDTTSGAFVSGVCSDFSIFRHGAVGQTQAAHYIGSQAAGTTTIAAGAAAGTSPPTPTLSNANDARGQINAGTGTATTTGTLLTVTFAQPYRSPAGVTVVLMPLNQATAAVAANVYVGATTAGFTIGIGTSALAISQATGVYQWYYQVLG
jgi:hypothetical protein